jgi:hypothetical protein
MEKSRNRPSRFAILAMACAALSAPLTAGTITYQLKNVHTDDGLFSFTGFQSGPGH